MTRRRKLMFAAGAVAMAILVAGLGAAGAIAGSRMLSSTDASKAVIDDAAAQLGVESGELSDALKEALKNRIEEAVEDGRLGEERADELKDRIDAGEYPRLGLFGYGHPGGFPLGFGHLELLEEAAAYLGMTEEELREALRDRTLAEIAQEQGKTVEGLVDRLVAAQTKRIDQAITAGRLTEEQAAALEAGLPERTGALVNGELRRGGDGKRHRFWHGSSAPREPPPFGGPTG